MYDGTYGLEQANLMADGFGWKVDEIKALFEGRREV